MIKEYAIDPAAFSNWNDFRFFSSQFGCEHGRMISRFPKKWKKIVYELCTQNVQVTEIQLSRIEILLFNAEYKFDRKFVRNSRQFDTNIDWLSNTILSNKVKPFHAIISTERRDGILNANDIDENSDIWKVETNVPVKRVASELVKYFKPFFELTNDILFVEPHFDPGTYKWYHSFQLYFAELFRLGKRFRKIEMHTSAKINKEHFINVFKTKFERIITDGNDIDIYMWDRIDDSENFHPRYLLTDVGGIRIDYGYDEVSDNETTDVQFLGQNLYELRLGNIQIDSSPFQLKAHIKIFKDNGNLQHDVKYTS